MDLGYVGVSQAANVGGSLAQLLIATHFLTAGDFGVFVLAQTGVLFGQQVLFAPIASSSLRFWSSAVEDGRKPQELAASTTHLVQLAVVALVIVGATTVLLVPSKWTLVTGAIVLSLFSGLSGIGVAIANANLNRQFVASVTVGAVFSRILVMFFALSVWRSPASILWASAAIWSGEAALYAVRFRWLKISRTGLLLAPTTKNVFQYGWPFLVTGTGLWARSSADRWVLALVLSPAQAGIYAASYQLLYIPIQSLASTLNQFIAPVVFRSASSDADTSRRIIGGTIGAIAIFSMAFGTLIVVAGDRIITRLISEEFVLSSWALLGILLAGSFVAIGQTIGLGIMGSYQSSRLVLPTLLPALIGTLATLAGGIMAGLSGVIAALIFFGLVYIVLIYRAWTDTSAAVDSS